MARVKLFPGTTTTTILLIVILTTLTTVTSKSTHNTEEVDPTEEKTASDQTDKKSTPTTNTTTTANATTTTTTETSKPHIRHLGNKPLFVKNVECSPQPQIVNTDPLSYFRYTPGVIKLHRCQGSNSPQALHYKTCVPGEYEGG